MFKYTNCVDINQGAFGTVIRALQTTEDGKPIRLVALKRVIEKQFNERNPIKQSPKEEIEIMRRLNHPNVIKCLDAF